MILDAFKSAGEVLYRLQVEAAKGETVSLNYDAEENCFVFSKASDQLYFYRLPVCETRCRSMSWIAKYITFIWNSL